jgi:hypothetical protein
MGYEPTTIADFREVRKGLATDEWPELENEECVEEDYEIPDEEEELPQEEDELLSGEVTKPYLGNDDQGSLEDIEKSGKPLQDLLHSGLTASAWRQLVELRKDRVYQAVQELSDGDEPVYEDEIAAHLGLDDVEEIKDIIADLAADGLVEPVRKLSPHVERAMTELRGAWNRYVRRERQAARENLREEVRDLRLGFQRVFGLR